MTVVKGYFDEFHFSECKIEKFEIIERDLIVDIQSNLAVYPPHPLTEIHKFSDPCKVIFKTMKHLRRGFCKYDEKSKQYKKEQKLIAEFNQESDSNRQYKDYGIEGFLLNPLGWLDFEIIAEEFYFDDLRT